MKETHWLWCLHCQRCFRVIITDPGSTIGPQWFEELEEQGFLQVHRSFVVNLEKVKAVHTAQVLLDDGKTIPLSRTYKQMLREERHPLFAS